LPQAFVNAQPHSEKNSLLNKKNKTNELAKFLSVPIDLFSFKMTKGPSNNGACKVGPWAYRPKKSGFFYQYMLFSTPKQYNESDRFGGFSIVVYKFGKEVGDYYDRKETLIAIWCRLKDPDLGRADLVGQSIPELKMRFGQPFALVGDVLVYHHQARALSVHVRNGVVDWFKYIRLSRNIDSPESIPNFLLQPGSRWALP
jgi:hypothetical protein